MRKDTLILLCTPDINRIAIRRCLGSLKGTNLERAELHIFDNNFNSSFSHPKTMESALRKAERQNMSLLFLDDDVEIYRYDWIDRLHQVAKDLDADITSCIQTDDSGRINSLAECLNEDGTTSPMTEFRHSKKSVKNNAAYAPALCSAIMLITDPKLYHIDLTFRKYKQDIDICMQAWDIGRRVGVALDMHLIHNRGFTGELNPAFKEILQRDTLRFAKKWNDKLDGIRNLPELLQYTKKDRKSWTDLYNYAVARMSINLDESIDLFKDIIGRCYIPRWVASSHYYLFKLTGNIESLIACNKINPCHIAARESLKAVGKKPGRSCEVINDCRYCELQRFGYVYNDMNKLLKRTFASI